MSNSNAVSTFDFNRNTIRVVELDGTPWFVAKDVCDALGLRPHPRGGYSHHMQALDRDEKLAIQKSHRKFMGLFEANAARVLTISESGLYKLALRAQRTNPVAKPFQDWVTQVVLPTVRKEGAYVAGEENIGKGTEEDDGLISGRAERIIRLPFQTAKSPV